MTLRFEGDAICLSGLTGTKLKCDVIGEYYPFWWSITSGGASKNYQNPTAIVELNAATGEVYIEETKETVLGSAGHALELKVKKAPDTENLKIILIEENKDCYEHLKKVIKRRWPEVSLDEIEGPMKSNSSNIYLLNMKLNDALQTIEKIHLGNSLFFFDPLRSVEYSIINDVASKRMKNFFQIGTEFFIFVFTSDWFLGRDDFAPLPVTIEETRWNEDEKRTVLEADAFFGNKEWHTYLLNKSPIEEKEKMLIELYKKRLQRWFRYVLPLPFNPKKNQIFHLILCSNYEVGVRMTKNAYASKTGNPKYSPDNKRAYKRFSRLHANTLKTKGKRKRPLEWLILWRIITQHEDGICDHACEDIQKLEPSLSLRRNALEWLSKEGYLEPFNIENAWHLNINRYKLNWDVVKKNLGVDPPTILKPISPEQFKLGALFNP